MGKVGAVRCWSGGGPQNAVWNWGDAITPTLYELVTGRRPRIIDYTDLTSDPHLIVCGSTLKWITPGSIVWGTGEIAESMTFMAGDIKPLHVAAVRGPLTRARLLAADIECPEVYGDPALLFPSFYKPRVEKSYKLGIIAHYIDAGLPLVEKLAGRDDIKIIDITRAVDDEKVYSFIDEVLTCERIVSSSLHGLILADAYGIPTAWVRLSDNVYGHGFKFRDYFMSVGRDVAMNAPLESLPEATELIGIVDRLHLINGPIHFDPACLLKSFPDY